MLLREDVIVEEGAITTDLRLISWNVELPVSLPIRKDERRIEMLDEHVSVDFFCS